MAEVLKIKLVEPEQLPLFKQPLNQIEQALSEPNQPPVKLYYVHYIDYNKRLDEWVTIDRMRLDKLQPPTSNSTSANAAHSMSQSHLCNISNNNNNSGSGGGSTKDVTGLLKHDLNSLTAGGDEHGGVLPKKKKTNKTTIGGGAVTTTSTATLHNSMSLPVNLSRTMQQQISQQNLNIVIEQTPSTPTTLGEQNLIPPDLTR